MQIILKINSHTNLFLELLPCVEVSMMKILLKNFLKEILHSIIHEILRGNSMSKIERASCGDCPTLWLTSSSDAAIYLILKKNYQIHVDL